MKKLLRLVATLVLVPVGGLVAAPPPGETPSTIGYNPETKIVQGSAAPGETYQLAVTGPTAASTANPVTVQLGFSVLAKPDAVDAATAASFISASPATLTFTSGAQTVYTNVTVAVPPGTQAGDFQWGIKPLSWPAAANVGVDNGASVNASVVNDPAAEVNSTPTAVLTTPAEGAGYVYDGVHPVAVDIDFSGFVPAGGQPITSMEATFEGAPLIVKASGLGGNSATGQATTPGITVPGVYTIIVAARSAAGVGHASAEVHVDLATTGPAPVVVINDPAPRSVYTHTRGTPALDLPFEFTVTASPGYTVSNVGALLDGVPVSISSPSGAGGSVITAEGTLGAVAPGFHTFTAQGQSAGIPVRSSNTFEVREVLPPTVSISEPQLHSTYVLASGSVTVPLAFTGASGEPGAVITAAGASLDGNPVSVTFAPRQAVVSVEAQLAISSPGQHTICVTATDPNGSATANRTFAVVSTLPVSGAVFFDANANGAKDSLEPGIRGFAVTLRTPSGEVVGTTTTAENGSYSFSVVPGSYVLSVSAAEGFAPTTPTRQACEVSSSPSVAPDVGFTMDWSAVRTMKADGCTIGYWKNNLQKAAAEKGGAQVSASALNRYTAQIGGSLALSSFAGITTSQAIATLSSTSSQPTALLAKQLLASEYNYAAGAYLDGHQSLTLLFITWGEYVLQNPGEFSDAEINRVKDWFDAYNNTHGGVMAGPLR